MPTWYVALCPCSYVPLEVNGTSLQYSSSCMCKCTMMCWHMSANSACMSQCVIALYTVVMCLEKIHILYHNWMKHAAWNGATTVLVLREYFRQKMRQKLFSHFLSALSDLWPCDLNKSLVWTFERCTVFHFQVNGWHRTEWRTDRRMVCNA